MEDDEPLSSAEPLLGNRDYSPLGEEEDADGEFELGYAERPATGDPPGLGAWISSRYPSYYAKGRRVLDYLQGPTPSKGLTGESHSLARMPVLRAEEPAPFLHFTRTSTRHSYHISLESYFIHHTRFLTSPWVFALSVPLYLVAIGLISRAQSFQTPPESFISCTTTLWYANNACGLDGQDCRPFENATFDFRCPAGCKPVFLHNPRTVGSEQVVFEPLIVGGGDEERTYRGDSFICAAALQAYVYFMTLTWLMPYAFDLHSGLISNARGGCVNVRLIGSFTNFLPNVAHGLRSIGFPTSFPLSFRLERSSKLTHCADMRNEILALNVVVTVLIFVLFRPQPLVLFWSLVCIGFWHATLFSQPRSQPPDVADGFGTFLPALFVCYAFWRVAFRFVMPIFAEKMPLEGVVWYLGPYWVAVLNNLTFDRLPIDRLMMSDITARPGGLAALLGIVVVLAAIVLNQVRVIRRAGWLPYYLGWYIAGASVTLVLALLPSLNLRIHHYVFAMMFIPGTAFPTRLSAVYQGLLLGLFLNGAAAWGFDSMLQTAAQVTIPPTPLCRR